MFSSNTSQVSEDRLYVEDVFSTFVYAGNGSTQTITNGIDLAGKGGMVWSKARTQVYSEGNAVADTARGAGNDVFTNLTYGYNTGSITSFNSNGFSLSGGVWRNSSGQNYASWTFRKAPKFFDVVTYTGNGTAGRTIAHNLGVAPGCIIVKQTSGTENWRVYHSSTGNAQSLYLNTTDAALGTSVWNSTSPTSTAFTVSGSPAVNGSGSTYVAYLFAHDTTSDGIIQCGSFTTDGSGNATVNLGWEPQWLLTKQSSSAGAWVLEDNMRGFDLSNDNWLFPNTSGAEVAAGALDAPTATGFTISGRSASGTYIYIAIRRGPMRTPTTGTSVFAPVAQTSTANQLVTTNFPVDLLWERSRNSTSDTWTFDRLRGSTSTSAPILSTSSTAAEASSSPYGFGFDRNNGVTDNWAYGSSVIYWNFKRAPSFMDVVCYTGTGVARTVNHNLGVAPELMIVKRRNSAAAWPVCAPIASAGINTDIYLNQNTADVGSSSYWNNTAPTASVFSLGASNSLVNGSGATYVAYLFASCPGVSKVGSYTGNGSSQTINCGFAAGARFVLIKRTDSTGSWWVWDTARGLVSGNDPALQLNSTAAETTGIDSVDPDSSGFIVNQDTTTNINVNAGTYVYLAIS